MKASIPRTATFAWSPASLEAAEPYLATGTVAGALDESFSNESVIEVWQPNYGAQTQTQTKTQPRQPQPLGTTSTSAKLNRLAWGYVQPSCPKGLLAAGLENGELGVWDAQKILDGAADPQILRNTTHSGPIRGLDYNPSQPNLLASGAVNGEIYIWDLTNPTKPYSPGARSSKLDEITSLSWNPHVPHILATSSSSGYTVVWDLKNKREVYPLTYGGGAGTANGLGGGPSASGLNGGALAAGARRGMGAVAWHPDISTRLVTASEDDSSPIIMVWDLRNARAPEKILTGHDQGILSLSWCKQDSDLLLSCGKDNRTIAWNPQTCEIVGELPRASNWCFDAQWCPRNPDLLATASFDGKVGIHSLQATNQQDDEHAAAAAAAAPAPAADGSDIFDLPAPSEATSRGLTLKQPPKWLRRPVSATFGFGGQLVSVSNLPGQNGATQSKVVHLRDIVTEAGIVARAKRLQEAIDTNSLATFCDERSKEAGVSRPDDVANWKALQTLFQADSRDELVALLGFSKEDVAAKVSNAIAAYKTGGPASLVALTTSAPGTPSAKQSSGDAPASSNESEPDDTPAAAAPATAAHEPVVSFAEQDAASLDAAAAALEATPSETSTTISSEPKGTTEGGESEVTEPSLFSDDNGATGGGGGVSDQAGMEFFNSISGESGAGVRSAVPERVLVPHMSHPPASSVAATAGSPGPSSVASADLRSTTFRIYPSDESEADKLVTRAIVLGDFESAVSLCVSTDRFADALLLAVRGGPDLLARTQKTYFERRTTSLPYLRLFQSIVSDDLTDVVQNADLNEWQEIFVVLCTFAKQEEFSSLAEQLGQRLQFQYLKSTGSAPDAAAADKAKQHRKNAILCYLAAGKLEKVAGMWIKEMEEEEAAIRAAHKAGSADVAAVNGAAAAAPETRSLYSAHAEALQTFMEKITVFQNAVGYVDADLQQPTTSEEVAATGARTYKLAALYDRIHEYVELLADQGLIEPALKYINQTPSDYSAPTASGSAQASSSSSSSSLPPSSIGAHPARDRLLQADVARSGGQGAAVAAAAAAASSSRAAAQQPSLAYDPYAAPAPAPSAAAASSAASQSYGYGAPVPAQQQQPSSYGAYAPPAVPQVPSSDPYGSYNPVAAQPSAPAVQSAPSPYAPPPSMIPAPPAPISSAPSAYGAPPQAQAAAAMPPPPPPKRADGGWNDVPTLPTAPRRTPSAMGQKANPIVSPFPNSPAPTPGPHYGQQPPPAGPPRTGTPGARNFASPPPQGYGRPPSAAGSGFVRPPPQGPPRSGSAAGMRAPQPGASVPPVPSIPSVPGVPNPSANAGVYGPGPGQPQQPQQPHQQQQQQQYPGGPRPPPQGMPGPYGLGPGQPQQQQQQQHPGMAPPPPGAAPSAPGMPLGPPGQARPPINRSQTPGAGAGPPPARSQTPGARGGPASFKYPPGDRSHIPDAQKPIHAVLSRELARVKTITPPAQKRIVDDAERRLNILFDYLNNGLVVDAKMVQGLLEISKAIEARNQPAALQLHVQLATTASGDIAAALVGVKLLITRLGA